MVADALIGYDDVEVVDGMTIRRRRLRSTTSCTSTRDYVGHCSNSSSATQHV
jgi:hypothetical protein